MAHHRYPRRPCLVCGRGFSPGQPYGKCCGGVCSLVFCSIKALKRALKPRQRDQWGRVGLRVFRAAWKA